MKKIIGVIATLAIMIMCSITVLAATNPHWEQNGSQWSFIGRDGEKVCDKWQKSGENWYWLNSDGIMAVGQLVDDGENLYCVDETGKMIHNNWVFIDNEDYDGRWMYFAPTGRAVKDGWKEINGKKYFFEDKCMNYGFLDAEGKMIDKDSDEAWKEAVYYCHDNNNGAQLKNAWLEVISMDADNGKTWIYFGVNGKKVADCKKSINGSTYVFNEDGSMKTSFVNATVSSAPVSAYLDNDGKMLKKGWVYAYLNEDADCQNWFYAQNNGILVKDAVKTINGKKYAFDSEGRMLTGFVAVDPDTLIPYYNISAEDVTFDFAVGEAFDNTYMYFTENADPAKQGAAFTGKQTIACQDANLTINFNSRGLAQGSAGKFVIKKNYAYVNSVLYARADMDYKYEIIFDEEGTFYILTVKTGKVSKKGTFTDNDNNVRYIINNDVPVVQHKNAAGKWE